MTENTESTEKKVVNNVTMEDGSVVNFGSRMTVRASFNEATNEIKFSLLNGKVITWVPEIVASLEGMLKTIAMYGLLERIKTVYGPVKDLGKIETIINRIIASINSGVFPLGRATSDEVELSTLQKAYALAKAQKEPEQYAAWVSIDNPTVIEEVLTVWDKFDRQAVQTIRRNPIVKYHLAQLEMKEADDSSLI